MADSYLAGILADGARPFRHRAGVRELLGLVEDHGVQVTFATTPHGGLVDARPVDTPRPPAPSRWTTTVDDLAADLATLEALPDAPAAPSHPTAPPQAPAFPPAPTTFVIPGVTPRLDTPTAAPAPSHPLSPDDGHNFPEQPPNPPNHTPPTEPAAQPEVVHSPLGIPRNQSHHTPPTKPAAQPRVVHNARGIPQIQSNHEAPTELADRAGVVHRPQGSPEVNPTAPHRQERQQAPELSTPRTRPVDPVAAPQQSRAALDRLPGLLAVSPDPAPPLPGRGPRSGVVTARSAAPEPPTEDWPTPPVQQAPVQQTPAEPVRVRQEPATEPGTPAFWRRRHVRLVRARILR